jgi:hypothetical protein
MDGIARRFLRLLVVERFQFRPEACSTSLRIGVVSRFLLGSRW